MDKIELTTAERETWHHWRFCHPHPRIQLKMEALYLKSQGLAPDDMRRLCVIAKTTFSRYLHEYRTGGLEKLQEVPFHQRQSPLTDYCASIEAAFRQCPPATVAEAGASIAALTGLRRGPTQVRRFFKSLGMNSRKGGQIPAKADVTVQADCKVRQLESRVAEAPSGQRLVFFMDAAHVVFAPFLGWVWCFERLCVKAPTSGRQRLNVLAALNAITREIFPVTHLTYITSETVCELLRLLAGIPPGVSMTIVLDNARYQRCALVQSWAQKLGIELLFVPAYSPNLHLIERFWKFVKKPCLYSKYYTDHLAFQQAIIAWIEQAPDKHKEELASLLTLKFQSFKAVRVIGEESNISVFPVARQRRKKVSSKAA